MVRRIGGATPVGTVFVGILIFVFGLLVAGPPATVAGLILAAMGVAWFLAVRNYDSKNLPPASKNSSRLP